MVSGNPFLDDDDVDENDLDLSLGLQDLHVSSNQNIDDKVAGGFGFDLDDDVDDDEDDLALPSLDDYDDEFLTAEQEASSFSPAVESENRFDDTAPVDNQVQDDSMMSTDVDPETEDEILFDDEDDSVNFDSGSELNTDNRESKESSSSADESHGSIIYGDFDDDEFIFDDDEEEDDDFSDNSFLSSPSDGVLDADGVRDIVRRLEMAGAEPENEDTNDDEIDEDDDNFAWVDDEEPSSGSGSPFMQRGLLSGGPEFSEDDEEEGGWSFEEVPPEEEGFSDSRLFEDDDETLFDDDEDEDDLYDFDSPDSTDFLTNDFSDGDQIDPGNISDSDQDNNFKDDKQPVDSSTPDGSVSDSDGSSSNKTSDDTKDNESSFTERLKALAVGLGERVSAVVTDVKNDLRGHDGEIPDSASDDEDEDGSDSKEKGIGDNKSKKPGSRKSKNGSSNPLKSLLSTIGGFYNKLVGIFFKILTSVLGVLASIPVIGRPFKIALAATRVLEIVAKSAPALLLIAGLVAMSWMSVPGSTTTELPDEGKVEFSSFSYSNGGTALGVMKNTGEVSVEGQAQFTVYSLQPGWNPNSWFIYQAEKTCESNVVTVDIESQTEVSASCGQASGWLPRVSGTIK